MVAVEVIVVVVVVLIIYIAIRLRQNFIMYQQGYAPIPDDEKPVLSKHLITQSKDSVELIIAKDHPAKHK
ncbi:hypothetical protein H257_01562 [Aphanomyces astaci]|nr:hypothetical protein H257_01562 [Aphanomyces astaci]ETV88267.1 hypothetical protein H257_01562 [Aphanomyces astaci]RHX96654.1 hypothetical protein DYB36_001310 [Aphanomyces astaci]RHY03293.1 hypothetical protein DYB25_002517 [Aphanomyces astaci]RHY44934.1 hypothetical protein DYB30_007886 [Aphanomyces astaci]RHY64976.1 hypothetical protein DYB38_007375 [Aphanomyces astaci]|eukprot:XP_009823130.1 hypothetical protein H257_01562 [Aphanomyces astaci]